MARSTRVSRGTRFTRTSRKFVWARRLILAAPVGANTAVFSDLLADFQAAFGADPLGITITRIRGMFTYSGWNMATAGVRVMTQSDFATMVSPAQGPDSDRYADWMMYQPLCPQGVATLAGISRQEIDVKSNRKLDELGQGLLLSVSNPTLNAGAFDANLSIGIKLP